MDRLSLVLTVFCLLEGRPATALAAPPTEIRFLSYSPSPSGT